MSLYNKKKTLALALAVAMIAPAAYAYNVQTGGDAEPEAIATQAGADDITMSENVVVNIELGDIIVGRTTGFQMLVTLQDGATFGDTAPTVTAGAALTGTWAVTLAAGGTPGDTVAQYTFEPQASGSTVSTGELVAFSNVTLDNVPTADGALTRARFLTRDPVSTATLHAATAELIVRDDGLAFSCTPQENPDRIDVGDGEYAPRTSFVEGPVYPIGGGDTLTASLGVISVDATGGYELQLDDTLTSTISGDFAAFDSVFLSSAPDCSASIGEYVVATGGETATFNEEIGTMTGFDGTGGSATLCVTADGETQIAAQTFSVQNGINEVMENDACPVAPLQYNGSVVDVYHVNPAGNTTAQSFVRVINPSNLDGRVTVVGWDDNGNAAGPISFTLPAGNSKQFNSVDLEEGAVAKGITGSFGNGAGKWRLEITGEFDGMLVQGLNRNQNDGTVTNLTDADAQMEQQLLHTNNGPFGPF